MRLLIIGIDGGTAAVLEPAMAQGLLPHLAALHASGWHLPLRSTTPPLTAPAWATFLTGVRPLRHGVLDFVRYEVATRRLQLIAATDIRVPTIWERLSAAGITVGVINVPLTYPPLPLRGFLVSGLLTPSLRTSFTYPPELAEEIRTAFPRYRIVAEGERTDPSGRAVLLEAAEEFDTRVRVAERLATRLRPDVLMVQFQSLDVVQHRLWAAVHDAVHTGRPESVAAVLRALDGAVGGLLALGGAETPVLLLSDHGFGPLRGTIFLNRALRESGYLAVRRRTLRARARGWLDGWPLGRLRPDVLVREFLDENLPVIWSRTRVCHVHGDLAAAVYLNVRGRDPEGTVQPGAPFERLRDDVSAFLGRLTGGGGEPVVASVRRGEEVVGIGAPDLVVFPHPGWIVSRKLGQGPLVRPDGGRGTHREEGIVWGRGLPQPSRSNPALEDMAPAILDWLGVPVPPDLDGRPLGRSGGGRFPLAPRDMIPTEKG